MKILRKLFGSKSKVEPVKAAPVAVAPVKPPKPVITLDVVEQTSDEQELLKLASDGATSQLRQAAAEKISSREILEALAKAAKNKDKNVFKIVKTKLDVFKAEDAKQAELEARAQQVCEKLERHSVLEADALFKARLNVLQQEWTGLGDGLSDKINARYQAALAACEAKIAAQAAAIAEEEERQAADAQAMGFAQAALADLKKLQQELTELAEVTEEQFTSFALKVQELAQALRLAANRAIPLDSISKEFELRKQQLLNLLDQIKTSGTLTQLAEAIEKAENSDAAKALQQKFKQALHLVQQTSEQLPAVAQAAKARVDGFFAAIKAEEQAVKDNFRQFNELLRKGLWAAEQGFVRKARGIQKELQEKRDALGELPKAIASKLEDFEAQLVKLGDWHEFAVTPKKEALISEMQGLVNSQLDPEALASKIHDLQDSWKEVSKGGQQQDDDLWHEFQQASEAAFTPCREFFEAQARARESNLTKRGEMVEQLRTYLASYDWDKAVWKDVEQTLKVARQEWQTYWPVPRKAGNDLQKTFEGLMEELFGKITAEHEKNKQAKQALIDQAQALAGNSDNRAAVETIKQLQAQWKTIGKSWYKEDQQLWQTFREHCDVIFAARNQAMDAAKAEREANQQNAENLIAKLESLLTLDLDALRAAKEEIETIKEAFTQLRLPRESAKALDNQFHKALGALKNKESDERVQAKARAWEQLFATAEHLRQYEVNLLSQGENEQLTEVRAQLEAILGQNQSWPSGAQSLLNQRLQQAAELTPSVQHANTQALHTLCIRAEIFANRESPAADKEARMSYQVQQMQQAFGQRDQAFEPLLQEWLALGAVADSDYQPLLKRFIACKP